jgi:adenylyl- and sulfurtransferase ThiI
MITYELYKLNKECIVTFSEIKIKYLNKNQDLSNLCHNIINLLKEENKEFENGNRAGGKDNTNQRVIKWHGKGISK